MKYPIDHKFNCKCVSCHWVDKRKPNVKKLELAIMAINEYNNKSK